MYTGGSLIERRRAKRFQVDWQIKIEASIDSGERVVEMGVLRNISSSGALLSIPNAPAEGTALDVYIQLPLEAKKWMKYPAQIIRVEPGVSSIAAVKFDTARPVFESPGRAAS
jgi:hypothetical protein